MENINSKDDGVEVVIIPGSVTDHTTNGWINNVTWLHCLFRQRYEWIPPISEIDKFYSKENRIFLFADQYKVHVNEE